MPAHRAVARAASEGRSGRARIQRERLPRREAQDGPPRPIGRPLAARLGRYRCVPRGSGTRSRAAPAPG